jgi:hypothetical protein
MAESQTKFLDLMMIEFFMETLDLEFIDGQASAEETETKTNNRIPADH